MSDKLVVAKPFDQKQLELITNTVAKGATPDELKLFLYTASRTGLDPLTKQIHFVKRYDSKLGREVGSIQTGIDGYRAIAERTGSLAGIDDAIFDDETGANPNKASVTVYRIVNGERVSFTASARWNEYVSSYRDKQTGQQKLSPMWAKMPYLMLGKCAEALALRKAFPNDLSGIYTNEEMQQADREVIEIPIDDKHRTGYVAMEEEENFADVVADEAEKFEPTPTWKKSSNPVQRCPFCDDEHTGRYPKCYNCWKSEKDGATLTPVKTKTIINEDVPPFVGDEFSK